MLTYNYYYFFRPLAQSRRL